MIIRKIHPLLKILNSSLIDLPSPLNISTWWNFGSLLGLCLITQILTGLFLAIHFIPETSQAFSSVIHIIQDVNNGWLIRSLHANGASLFFICLYLHVGRGIYYGSFKITHTWSVGVLILFITMATAFVGYVLPWGQISFWGATVITNLLSAIPYLGNSIVIWLWGGYSVGRATLTRFFAIHFILPFIILALVIIHLIFLHQRGSSNPLGTNSDKDKIPFHPFFSIKDLVGFVALIFALLIVSLYNPYLFIDSENFIKANPMVTPIHIQPEWYFLYAYAILRSTPRKLGGVVALVLSIAILFVMPLYNNKVKSCRFYFF